MSDGTIEARSEGAVRVLAFHRPEKKNALTQAMYVALNAALDEASADNSIRAILLTGSDGVFTSGNDIADFLRAPADVESMPVFQFLFRLADLAKPLVAAIDGAAVGIGTTLLMHTDDAIATTRAKFAMPFVGLGLVPEAGSSLLLPQMIGMQRASRWVLGGEPFDAQAALQAGLINQIVEPDLLGEVAIARAQLYASRPLEAVLASKKLLRGHQRAKVKETIAHEVKIFAERLQSAEAKAAFAGFLAKKK